MGDCCLLFGLAGLEGLRSDLLGLESSWRFAGLRAL